MRFNSSLKRMSVAAMALALTSIAKADDVTVNWSNTAGTTLRDSAGNPLSPGVATLNTDGALVQLGYFSMASAANNFLGTWVPLTGFGLAPNTTVGDTSNLNPTAADRSGRISFNTFFTIGSNIVQVYDPILQAGAYVDQSSRTIDSTTPPNGQILAIRFFSTNDGTSGDYNTVSADSWQWVTPSLDNPSTVVTINLGTSAASLEWEDMLNPFEASIPVVVPEPTSVALIACGAVAILWLRRRSTS